MAKKGSRSKRVKRVIPKAPKPPKRQEKVSKLKVFSKIFGNEKKNLSKDVKPSFLKSFLRSRKEIDVKPAKAPVSLVSKKPKVEAEVTPVSFPDLPAFDVKQSSEVGLLEEGMELAKLSRKFQRKLKPLPKVELKQQKKFVYVSKREKDLSREQEVLKKKLDSLY